jgi:hypothetical protein
MCSVVGRKLQCDVTEEEFAERLTEKRRLLKRQGLFILIPPTMYGAVWSCFPLLQSNVLRVRLLARERQQRESSPILVP